MTNNIENYSDTSIQSLKGADRVRKRPSVIFGSDGIEGCEHCIFEILSNSVDEAREGYGDTINITVFNDKSVTIEDFGRGVPLDYNPNEKRYNWELVFCELYAGSKYNNNSSSSHYKYALGLNGLGAASTQYASEFMNVTSYRGGEKLEMHFESGEPIGELVKTPLSRKEMRTGTVINWKPDLRVFTDIDVPKIYFDVTLERQAVVNAGITFNFKWQNEDGSFEEKTFAYKEGIKEYMQSVVGDKYITTPVYWQTEGEGKDRDDKEAYSVKLECIFCFTNENNFMDYYHNSSYLLHGGSSDRAVKNAFTYAIDKYIKTQNKYNKNESKISFSDIEDSFAIIVNTFSTQTSYANQTKLAISNEFIYQMLNDYFKQQLEYYFAEKPQEADKIINQVLINKRSRESAESSRLNLKKTLQMSNDVASKIEKYVACRSKDVNVRELYIVEGDSALTSCKLARDSEYQAIIPVRGKTLNCLKASFDKIFKNDIIVDLLKLIGCGVEVKGKKSSKENNFDLDGLKWNKIIICTDADEDGFQIRTLILTMFYRLLPTLIKEGRVYIAETPLFEITTSKNTYFAFNEKEKVEILDKIGKTKYTIQRSKGLGENDPEMMWQTTMNPETRHLIKVSEADRLQTQYIFETLLGDDLAERKSYIQRHGKNYISSADV